MKNSFLFNLRSSIVLNIKGKNVNRFINKLVKQNIDILNIKYINYKEIEIRVFKSDLEKIEKIKSIYELSEVNSYGLIKIKKILIKNKILLFFMFIGFLLILLLTNVIFDVEVVHNKKEIQELLISELKKYGITEKKFVKSFNEIEKIKKEILEKYKDKLEWIEIERVGTKYIVRVEERNIPNSDVETQNRNIVAKKSAIIKTIIAENGVVVKNVNDYVKAGDVIVSGNIYLNEALKSVVRANGKVYGEVWYKSEVEMPFVYYEENYTSNTNKVLTLSFLNKRFELFNFNKFENKEIDEKNIVKHLFLPIKLSLETQREVKKTDKIYTIDEAIEMAKNNKKNNSNKKNINVQRIVAIVLLVAMIAMYLSSLFMYK